MFLEGDGPGTNASGFLMIQDDDLVEDSEFLVLRMTTNPLSRLAFSSGEEFLTLLINDNDGEECLDMYYFIIPWCACIA